MRRIGDSVLLERSRLGETVALEGLAVWLVTVTAEVTVEAGAVQPLQADMVADLVVLVCSFAQGYYDAGTFMAAAEGELGVGRPVADEGVVVGVADAVVRTRGGSDEGE